MPAFEVDESIEIQTSIATVREALLNFQTWPAWSPWICAEPGCKVDVAGDGQSYTWDGSIIGSGGMKVIKAEDAAIYYDLEFVKPFKSKAKVDFQLEGHGDERCTVRWRMQSSMPFFLFFMVKSTQAMVAADYRRGLARLKDQLELGKVPSVIDFPGVGKGLCTAYLGVRRVSTIAEIGRITAVEMPRLMQELEERGVEVAGPPMTITHSFDPVKDRLAYTMALPVPEVLGDLGSDLVSEVIDIPKSYKVVHKGAYHHLANAWASGVLHERAKRFSPQRRADKVEVYISDPGTTAAEDLVTELHFPAK